MSEDDLLNVVPGCGTYAGYQRHRKRGEDACRFCKDANNEYARTYRRTHPADYESDKRKEAARKRALWRLAADHPEQFQAYVAEEMRT